MHPVGPVVTGVRAAAPFSSAADLLRFYRDFAAELPDEMTLNAGLRHAADGSGRKLAGLLGCHVGPAEQAERDLRPLLELPASVEREVGPLPYTTLNSLLDPVYPRGAWNYWKSGFLHGLSDEAIARLLEWFGRTPSSMTTVVIENLRGAVTRVPAEATAFPHRDPGFNLLLTSVWSDPAATGRNVEWTRRTHATLAPHLAERCYATYLAEDEVGEAATRAAFGPNAERLAEVKRVYDPANLFRLNQNVRPARGAR